MMKPDPEVAKYLNDILVDLVAIDLESKEGIAQWAVAARIIRQLSFLSTVNSSPDDTIGSLQRIQVCSLTWSPIIRLVSWAFAFRPGFCFLPCGRNLLFLLTVGFRHPA